MIWPARRTPRIVLAVAMLLSGAACTRQPQRRTASGVPLVGPLIPARTTIVTAWDFPENPASDATLDDSKLSQEIRLGFRIFMNTPREAARFAPGAMSCNNCHLNGGQREKSLPLVNVAGMFPEYNKRAGRLFTLGDRVVDCFLRSENATGAMETGGASSGEEAAAPTPSSKEVLAVTAYLTWLSRGSEIGKNPSWRGQNTIAAANLVPIDKLDSQKGETIFVDRCRSCHGADGQGVTIGDKRAGPLWGPNSWNDGAGAARVYTLAGIVRYSMPYLDPGSLTDEDAQEVAAFIDAKPRPAYPFKQMDYRVDKLPPDALYYRKAASADP
jgi:thiosulfate dehydrogenase